MQFLKNPLLVDLPSY